MGRISPVPRKPKPPLGELLYNARIARRVGLRQLEEQTGIPASTIQAWENGQVQDPRVKGLLRLARVLRVGLDELERAAIGDWLGERNGATGEDEAHRIVDEATVAAEGLARQAQRSVRRRDTR